MALTRVPFDLMKDAIQWSEQIASLTVANGDGVMANTTAGVFTVTLPLSPSVGDRIAVRDAAGTFNTNNLTIAGNGNNIDGAATLVLSSNNDSKIIVWTGTEWKSEAASGGSGSGAGIPVGGTIEAPIGFSDPNYVEATGTAVLKSSHPELYNVLDHSKPSYNTETQVFTAANSSTNIYTTDFVKKGTRIVAVGQDTVTAGGPRIWASYSDDDGVTWSTPALLVAAGTQALASPTNAIAITTDGTDFDLFVLQSGTQVVHYHSTDGITWANTAGTATIAAGTGVPLAHAEYSATIGKYILVTAANFVYTSPTATPLSFDAGTNISTSTMNSIILAPDDSVVLPTGSTGISRTVDGVNWPLSTFDVAPTTYISTIVLSPNGTDLIACNQVGGVWKSSDNGATWSILRAESAFSSAAIYVDLVNNIMVMSHTTASNDLYSTDNGVTWLDGGTTNMMLNVGTNYARQLSTPKVILLRGPSYHNAIPSTPVDLVNESYIPAMASSTDAATKTYMRVK